MSIRKFRCDTLKDLSPGAEVTLERGEETHLFRILRALPGDEVELLDGRGRIASAEVKPGRLLQIRSIREIAPPPRRIHLYIAPPRRQKMDTILREATELGVWRLVPILCEYRVAEPEASSIATRWNDAMFEACKQSGNPYLPRTVAPLRFADALEECRASCSAVYFGSPTDSGSAEIPDGDIAWFVGPEGGFTEEEEGQMRGVGFHAFHFGNWTLRVETAAVCGIAILMDRFSPDARSGERPGR